MSKFTYKDVESAFNFAQKNLDLDLNDWLHNRSKIITSKELEMYSDITYSKFNMTLKRKKYDFYIFKSHSEISNFITRFVGSKGYYDFIPGDSNGYFYNIISFDEDFYDVDNWKDYLNIKDIKIVENKKAGIKFIQNFKEDFDNSNDFKKFYDNITILEINSLWFWDHKSTMSVYIDNKYELVFNKIDNLFKLEE